MKRIDGVFREKVTEEINSLLAGMQKKPKITEVKRYVRNWYYGYNLNVSLTGEQEEIINHVCANAYMRALEQVEIEEAREMEIIIKL